VEVLMTELIRPISNSELETTLRKILDEAHGAR
jgi:hypothetical protein